jgi:integrase
MAKRDVKGIARVTAKGRVYWYAWRGGPRLRGAYGTPDFWASYDEAVRDRKIPEPGKFRTLVTLYKAGPFQKLAPSTQRIWGSWLDRIAGHFGTLSIAQFDRPERIRPIIRSWRNQWATTPRTADYGMQVLSAVLSHAVDPLGKIAGNPCIGIKQLYASNRSDIIWTEADLTRINPYCTPEIAHAVDLAINTGLRLGDLVRLSWSHIQDDAIVITTGKSGHRIEAIIPLHDELREVLAIIPQRATTILTNSLGRPWLTGSLSTLFVRAKHKAGVSDVDLNFHDLRGTAATRFYVAGLDKRVIAEILSWTEESVDSIIRKYVDRSAATRGVIKQMRLSRQMRLQQQYSGNVIPIKSAARHPPRGVYFIQSGDRVKIGWSADVSDRITALQTGTPEPLHVIHVIPGEREDERRFHIEFAAQRIRGEWFRLEGGA